ncbi:TrmO family methyltransferase domain-containing protein [Paragemmobacter kunshanensis]|uniref:TrmO family methyltransferase domain-containing protein n=1 Tax=Paragemmobacter kunshanensis TaxID=2583234 RepID=UPI0019D07F56
MERETGREGELFLPFDPGQAGDATLAFIGHLETPWRKGDCPRNLTEARARGGRFVVHLDPAYRAGLEGLSAGMAVILIYWMAAARRDLIRLHPPHRAEGAGSFALRAPARPNPLALGVVRVLAVEPAARWLVVDACDAHDGTPLVDIKPWLAQVDIPPDGPGEAAAAVARRDDPARG